MKRKKQQQPKIFRFKANIKLLTIIFLCTKLIRETSEKRIFYDREKMQSSNSASASAANLILGNSTRVSSWHRFETKSPNRV